MQRLSRHRLVVLGVSALAVAALGACGTEPAPPGGSASPGGSTLPEPEPADDALLTTGYPVTILDDGDGPELCLGGVLTSYPPQCGGPRLVGWDWADHEGAYEESQGVRWGDFVVIGRYDGEEFAVERVLDEADWPAPDHSGTDFTSACLEPEGGWRVVDPELTTEETMAEVFEVAATLEGYAGAWLDQSINPAFSDDSLPSAEYEEALNDPELTVVNVVVTGDPETAEQQLREVWGGALCVSVNDRTESDLVAIQDELSGVLPGVTASWTDVTSGRVVLELVYDDGALQRQVDEEYGVGVVHIESALVPVE